MTKIELGDVIYWEMCLSIGTAMALSIRGVNTGIVLGIIALALTVYMQWAWTLEDEGGR